VFPFLDFVILRYYLVLTDVVFDDNRLRRIGRKSQSVTILSLYTKLVDAIFPSSYQLMLRRVDEFVGCLHPITLSVLEVFYHIVDDVRFAGVFRRLK